MKRIEANKIKGLSKIVNVIETLQNPLKDTCKADALPTELPAQPSNCFYFNAI
jgi:hypothetical protein